MKKWRKIVENYLNTAAGSAESRRFTDSGAAAPLLLRLAVSSELPVVAAFPDTASVDRAAADIAEFSRLTGHDVNLLTLPESGRGKLLFPGGEARRAQALDRTLRGDFHLLLGSVHALLGPAPPPQETREACLCLKPGMPLDPVELARKLTALDYDDEFEVAVSGEFARRGGIVDLFSPAHDRPCRVEFFGDTVESLRGFDPKTQRSTGELAEYRIIGRAGITAGGAANSDVFEYFSGTDYRLAVVHPTAASERLHHYASAAAGRRFADVMSERDAAGKLTAFYDAAEAAERTGLPGADVSCREAAETCADGEARRTAARLHRDLLFQRLAGLTEKNGSAVLLTEHAEDLPTLRTWCRLAGLPLRNCEFDSAQLGGGFTFETARLEIVAEAELVAAGFSLAAAGDAGRTQPAPPAKLPPADTAVPAAAAPPEFSLADLDVNDYAVHLEHGIGIFRGFKILSSGGIDREVMVLEFRDGELLYVPLLQAGKVSRYLGAPGRLKLHKLGGSRWNRDKENVRSGVRSYAADMLRLQAMRQAMPGIAFAEDHRETAAFLRAFPYRDTADQERATAEIARDMTASRPMDRLLCGDVGYGKTELAMRAAFRAAVSGYQTAVIAPTTVLAQQHFHSFVERFAAWPFTVGMLSRFCTPSEQADTIRRLESGALDIVIGTHRLCGANIRFKNLGLVIIDEEQRFGVEHKERLRRFRAEADVLAMSATPIPRTLYLAMAGARDLSTLMTPPKFRLPVKTVIAPESAELILSALQSELARGGQVYYLHNRVATIEACAERLRELAPDARIAVAHGQMPESALEEVMKQFLAGGIDCLVCSTIIESGLDVPNANTIIIEHADRFGLAELYQLRGRVGRWNRQAYAYLLLPRHQIVSGDARKRLAALRRCSTLGAGFQLALRDLEIRGSGNLLGAEQSGHLNTIGFDLYCRLLSEEIAHLRGQSIQLPPEADVAIDFIVFALKAPPGLLAAGIPPAYVGGDRLRVSLYRRLASLGSLAELEDFRAELLDRFGSPPAPVLHLLAVIRLKLLTAATGYRSLNVTEGRVVLCNPGGAIYRRPDGRAPRLDYRDSPELRLMHLEQILREAAPNNGPD